MVEERMRVTVVLEYAVNPDHYPKSSPPAERAEIDRVNFIDDPEHLSGLIDMHGVKSITVTPIRITS